MGGTKSSCDCVYIGCSVSIEWSVILSRVTEGSYQVKLGIIRGAALAAFIVTGKLGLSPKQSRPDRYGNRMYR